MRVFMKILFIGNSHTYVHYVPLRVKEFMKKHGVDAEIVMLTHPGMGLDWHMEQSQTYFNVMYGGFDTIILQHNAHPFPGKDQLIEAGKSIASIIPEGVKKYVYMTWSEKHNPEGQEAMSLAYEELAEVIDAEVCPVGRIWQQVKGLHPEEELYIVCTDIKDFKMINDFFGSRMGDAVLMNYADKIRKNDDKMITYG